jgi:Right handed beta helix region/FlgD Ig-like domain
MKKLYLILTLLISTSIMFCDTHITGGSYTTSTTWTAAADPYIIEGVVTFGSEAILTIEPGVIIKFEENTSLNILGKIIAIGSELNTIIFDSNVVGEKWNGIHLTNNRLSQIEHCEVSNSQNGGINLSKSTLIRIKYCSIYSNTSSTGAGVNIENGCSEILIENSSIYNNEGNYVQNDMEGGGGIACYDSDLITIDSNEIYSNTGAYDDFCSGGGIRVFNCSSVHITNNENISYNEVIGSGQGGGINISLGENNLISNNIIHHNEASFGGGGISLRNAASIVDNEIYNNEAQWGAGIYGSEIILEFGEYVIEDNEVHHNIASWDAGGIYLISLHQYSGRINISRCNIYSNQSTTGSGAGVYLGLNMFVQMDYCNIFDNEAGPNLTGGGGIYVFGASIILSHSVLRNNTAYRGGALYLKNSTPAGNDPVSRVDQCIIAENVGTSYASGIFVESEVQYIVSNIDCYNTIFYDNSGSNGQDLYIQHFYGNNYISIVKYNCFQSNGLYIANQTYVSTAGNIYDDPKCTNPDDYDYYLLPDSPCIDTGNPNWLPDPDGSLSDMGCIPYDHIYDKKFFHEDYNWISFPRLPMSSQTNTNQPVTADNIVDILSPYLPDYLELLYMSNVNPILQYDNPVWIPNDPDEYDLYSSRGYKLKTEDPENTEISIDGPRLEPDTEIDLQFGENWVGYWLTESQNIDDAFGEENFEKILSVKAEDWEWIDMSSQRGIGVPQYYPMQALEYGKGYVITLREAISDFQWQTGAPVIVKDIPKAEGFEYTALPDYETVIIDDIEGGSNVTEIGAFIDDICVGAAVVTEFPIQLLTYTQGVSRSPELTFEVVTNSRNSSEPVGYTTLDLDTGEFEEMSCILGRFDLNVVKLDFTGSTEPDDQPIQSVKLDGNYPNPFNPETSISFSLPSEQKVELTVYNLKGQKVRVLAKGSLSSGKHSIIWEGKDNNGKQVGSGLYFYKLKTTDQEISKKMLLLK